MRKLKSFLLITIILFGASTILPQKKYIRTISLPLKAIPLLNKEFGQWDYFKSPIPYFDSLGRHAAWEYADLIKGDFNNDHNDDFAILVKPSNTSDGILVVLLQNSNSYKLVKITKVPFNHNMVLYLATKGSELYNFDNDKTIILPVDGITLERYEKNGSTFYSEGGGFVEVHSSD